MIEEERDDPWAGGLVSYGRSEQFEEMQRLWDILSGGDFGFALTVTLPNQSPRIGRMMERLGRQIGADLTQFAIDTLLERNQ